MTKSAQTLLEVRNLSVEFPVPGAWWGVQGTVHAVQDVSFSLNSGETLGIVGESGCGKSTLGRAILNLIPPSAGEVFWDGKSLKTATRSEQRQLRRAMTIIFQDPLASLNPRMTVGEVVGEPLSVFEPSLASQERRRRILSVVERVGLPAGAFDRFPHQFSGGQCQRIGIARALILRPRMIVCDEAVSALDVSVQAQIMALLDQFRREDGVALLFISHNLAVVRQISDRVLVLYLGKVMEIGGRQSLYDKPRHPYTRALLSAVPIPDPDIERNRSRLHLTGDLPSAFDPPAGCVFHTRCPYAADRCRTETPVLEAVETGHEVACHFWRTLA